MAGKNLTLLPVLFFLLFSCSFDYGEKTAEANNQPDIVMENVEYVRVRGGDPLVRFKAELAERFEERQTMNLKEFSFEQFQKSGAEIDARGRAGEAQVELGSGNIQLSGGVTLSVDSEDITIQTNDLRWQDKEKSLAGSPDGAVDIERTDGTGFSGRGFSANVRSRTWSFDTGVSGRLVEEEDDEDEDAPAENEEAAVEKVQPEAEATDARPAQTQEEPKTEAQNAGLAQDEEAAKPETETPAAGRQSPEEALEK